MVLSKAVKGLKNPDRALQHLVKKPFKLIDRYFNYGTNVFGREWDLLVILDACRYDLFVEFAPQHSVYTLLDSVDQMYSIASQTPEWMQRTFDGADDTLLSQTLYVSGMGWIEEVDTDGLFGVEPVWRYADHPEARVTPPKPVTNESIRNFRVTDAERYIVHYVQPHAPFLHCVGKYNSIADGEGSSQNVWTGLQTGEFDKSEVWEDYGENLLLVLDEIELLIENFDGKIAITADHGNAMGEFWLYGHPGQEAAPSIRSVPWATAPGLGIDDYSVRDRGEVDRDVGGQGIEAELEQHLRDLGYRA